MVYCTRKNCFKWSPNNVIVMCATLSNVHHTITTPLQQSIPTEHHHNHPRSECCQLLIVATGNNLLRNWESKYQKHTQTDRVVLNVSEWKTLNSERPITCGKMGVELPKTYFERQSSTICIHGTKPTVRSRVKTTKLSAADDTHTLTNGIVRKSHQGRR